MLWKRVVTTITVAAAVSVSSSLTAVAEAAQKADKAAINAAVSSVKRQPSHDLEKDLSGGPSAVPGDWDVYSSTIQTVAQRNGKFLIQIQAMDNVMGRQLAEHQMGTINAEATFLVVLDTTKKPPRVDPKKGVLKCGSSEPENEEIAKIKSLNHF